MELAELDERPGRRLPDVARRVERELHRVERLARSAEQLAGVRDPRIAAEAGLQVDHAVEGAERLVVAAELEQGVAEEAVAAGRLRSERHDAACEPKRLAEVVPARGERCESGERDRIAPVELGARCSAASARP